MTRAFTLKFSLEIQSHFTVVLGVKCVFHTLIWFPPWGEIQQFWFRPWGEIQQFFSRQNTIFTRAHARAFLCTAAPILANFLLKIGFWAEMLSAPFFARDV